MRVFWKCICLLAIHSCLLAEFEGEIHPTEHLHDIPLREPPKWPDMDSVNQVAAAARQMRDTDVIIPETKGLILTSNKMMLSPEFVSRVRGVEIIDVNVPGKPDELKKRLLPIFKGQPLTMEVVDHLKQEIVEYYRSVNHPIVTVIIPEQDVTGQVLTLYLIEAHVGCVSYSGNKWFRTNQLKNNVRLKADDSIDSETLMQDLFWINRNPFRQSEIILKPGELEGTTDVEFLTRDRFPVRVYAGVENTGFKQTGTGRIFSGITWGNALGLDQTMSYQYTTSTKFQRFHAHTGNWTIPIPWWKHVLEFYGGYSNVKPEMPVTLSSNGESWQVSGRYTIPFQPKRQFLQELQVGADYKSTNNNLFFNEFISIVANTAVITQLMGRYSADYHFDYIKGSFDVALFWSPGDLFAHQSDAEYNQLRPGAESDYIYARGHFFTMFRLTNDFSFSLNTQFQIANQNLLPSEEFGIGGYSTVRGYQEREVNFDNAFVVSGELRTPPVSLIRWCRCSTAKVPDIFQFLLFIDYGVGNVHKKTEGGVNSAYLLSVGPGIRFNIDTNVAFRLDLGFKLHKVSDEDSNNHRFHFSFLLSY